MRALVYHGPGQKAWEEVPKPAIIDDTDAIVRVDAVTICGTDLHILKGDVPAVHRRADPRPRGRRHRRRGRRRRQDTSRPATGCSSRASPRAARAASAARARYGQCLGGGGWILGHTIDGTQAEYVRVPFADTSTYPVPAGVTDEAVLMLADILPTGYEVGVLNGSVRPGDVVAVVGAGPIGLAAIMGARLFSPSHIVAIDLADSPPRGGQAVRRRRHGQQRPRGRRSTSSRDLTGGLGADVAIEAVGVPATFELAAALVRPGRPRRQHRRARQAGHAAPRGAVDPQRDHHDRPRRHLLHADPAAAGRQPASSTPAGSSPTTSRSTSSSEAYDVFADAADTGALKVVLTRRPGFRQLKCIRLPPRACRILWGWHVTSAA